jgi:hypothetical protein
VVLLVFWFDGGVILYLLGPLLFLGPHGLLLLVLYLRRMGQPGNVDWTVGYPMMATFYPAYK